MVVKVYISGMSGSKEVKKRQQRVTMIMDSKHIEYSIIDITEPGQEGEKDFMQTNAAHKGCTISDPNPRHALPPQLFNDTEYCGDYDDFDLANEVDSLEVFLKVAPPPAPVPVETTEHKNGEAAAAADDENKENKTEANKDDNDAAADAEDAAGGDAVDGPNENADEVTVEEESPTGEAPEPEANGQLEVVDEEANSKLVTDNDATKDDPPQSVGEIDKEPDGSIGEENSETLPPGPDEETPDNVERGEAAENEPQKDDDAVKHDDSEHGSQAKEEPAPEEPTSERQEQATEEVNTTTNEDDRAAQTDHIDEAQQDADLRVQDSEAHEKGDAESNPEPQPVELEDPVERMAAEPEEPEALPDSKDEPDSGGSDDDRSQSRRSSTTDEQEEIEDVRPPNVVEDRPSSPAASKDAVEVRPVARGDGTMEADGSDSEEQELLRASAAALAGQSEDAQEIIEVDDEPLEEAEDTAEQQTGAEEEISSKLVDTDDPMLAEQEQEE